MVAPCSSASRRNAPAGACGGLDAACARRGCTFVDGDGSVHAVRRISRAGVSINLFQNKLCLCSERNALFSYHWRLRRAKEKIRFILIVRAASQGDITN
jgi:hypothetical protein